MRVRQATLDDSDDVVAFTENTWPEQGGDYIPRVFESWVESDGPTQRTFVLDAGEELAGICQGVLLSEHEAWAQGMRVNPDYRGKGVSPQLTYALFDWARERGASVCRNMVFSWNTPGLGQSRSVGFEPATEFRWATPEPDADAESPLPVTNDPDAAWSFLKRDDGFSHLKGLALDPEETYALSELTRERLHDAPAVVTVQDDDGTHAAAFRVRTVSYSDDILNAEYGIGAWDSLEGARSLLAAVARDAADIGADETRVLIPETPGYVSDAAYACGGISEEPDFVLEKDLSASDS
ncbi:GNAT family N-acetyltransferase [Natronomonas sp. EA1]|uniref:GNAT family N-acetyltransferase n=1 Tax=Natronomonas sp. EA1 TaxID=3421655 RepID=UPI003EB69DE6